ncbi:MAG: ribonuclease HII [Thermodesulfobacteriota bacterium]|nr:ribonuclease HII [Thermodesulfobacteriota bacterium]
MTQLSLFDTDSTPPEDNLRMRGFKKVAGVDEAGRGSLAGPVVAAAVILPSIKAISGIDDSKKLTPKKREDLFIKIKKEATAIGVGIVRNQEIDRINILKASILAMKIAVLQIKDCIEFLLIDGPYPIPLNLPQYPLKRGDSLSVSIGAASIIAKVTRDNIMKKLHGEYPHYNFFQNKGYGTKEHFNAIKQYGTCYLHRKTFCYSFLSKNHPSTLKE